MRCAQCQQDNPAEARFCNGCGARLQLACPSCGHVNPSGSRFWNGCGTKLSDQAATAAETRPASPESYTPKHLAEKIITSKAALEGERKQVTVLFADLKGSMELLADRDPEEARKILDPVLELMMEAVHRYEGTVNLVMGDGIMALFGAPLAHEDHAVRACYAALRMQQTVKRFAEEVLRAYGVPVRIRVGLNSGEVVVRSIGSDLRLDYTAVGQTTHLAARMEQIADPGTIVIIPCTLPLVEGYFAVKSLGPVPVKGLADPVEVYEVTGAGPARTRLQASARRGLSDGEPANRLKEDATTETASASAGARASPAIAKGPCGKPPLPSSSGCSRSRPTGSAPGRRRPPPRARGGRRVGAGNARTSARHRIGTSAAVVRADHGGTESLG